MSAVLDAAGSYRRLLGDPVLRGLAVADVCARLPQGMASITLLLVAAVHASMTTAGLVIAAWNAEIIGVRINGREFHDAKTLADQIDAATQGEKLRQPFIRNAVDFNIEILGAEGRAGIR